MLSFPGFKGFITVKWWYFLNLPHHSCYSIYLYQLIFFNSPSSPTILFYWSKIVWYLIFSTLPSPNKPRGRVLSVDIVAKPWYYNFHVRHLMSLGPKILFSHSLTWEKRHSSIFECPNTCEMTSFTIRIQFIRSDNIWKARLKHFILNLF